MRHLVAAIAVTAAAIAAAPTQARAAPRLECTCEYGGEEVRVVAEPTTDPYRVPAVPVGRRFLFRAVWVAAPEAEAGVNLYAYRATADGPVPLHQARYRPPLPTAATGSLHGFTGLQRVYEPSLGAELQYWCRWSE